MVGPHRSVLHRFRALLSFAAFGEGHGHSDGVGASRPLVKGVMQPNSTSSPFHGFDGSQPKNGNQFQLNDVVKIIKPGSSKYGELVRVIDTNWNGLIRVEYHGEKRTFQSQHLAKLDEGELAAERSRALNEHKLSPEVLEELQHQFDALRAKKHARKRSSEDATIDLSDFQNEICRGQDLEPEAMEEISTAIKNADADGSGDVDFEEFVALYQVLIASEELQAAGISFGAFRGFKSQALSSFWTRIRGVLFSPVVQLLALGNTVALVVISAQVLNGYYNDYNVARGVKMYRPAMVMVVISSIYYWLRVISGSVRNYIARSNWHLFILLTVLFSVGLYTCMFAFPAEVGGDFFLVRPCNRSSNKTVETQTIVLFLGKDHVDVFLWVVETRFAARTRSQ